MGIISHNAPKCKRSYIPVLSNFSFPEEYSQQSGRSSPILFLDTAAHYINLNAYMDVNRGARCLSTFRFLLQIFFKGITWTKRKNGKTKA